MEWVSLLSAICKKWYLILIVIFIILHKTFEILPSQYRLTKNIQSLPVATSLVNAFDIFCSFRIFHHFFQIFSLDNAVCFSEISRDIEYPAKPFFSYKRLMNQLKEYKNFMAVMLNYRFLTVKNYLEELQAKKNTLLSSFHPQDNLYFMNGLVFGKKTPGAAYVPDFENAGMLHVLVASGFNVALVAGAVHFFVKNLEKKWKIALVILTLWGYAAFLNFEPPILRATWMFSLVLLLQAWGRRTKQTHILAFSVLMILAFQPDLVSSLSLWLSALATLGIVVFVRRLSLFWQNDSPEEITSFSLRSISRRITRIFLEEGATSLAAQSLIFPLLIWYFESLNLVSFAANPLLLPGLGALTQLSALEFLLSGLDSWWWGRMLLWESARLTNQLLSWFFSGVVWWQRFAFLNSSPDSAARFSIIAIWAGIMSLFFLVTRTKREKESLFFHEKL